MQRIRAVRVRFAVAILKGETAMKLAELQPTFVRYETRPDPYTAALESEYLCHVDSLADAQGILFLCPPCFVKNGGPVGTHLIQVSFADRGVADHQGSHNNQGQPVRWAVSGTGYADLTTSPSILTHPAPPACDGWHGFVTNGEIR